MENLKEERKRFESLGLSYPFNDRANVEKATLAGVACYWFTPDQVLSDDVVVYLHGGGFMYGSIRSHRAMVSHIAVATGRKILFVEYSLAPEKPFPAALNEATAVVRELLRTTPGLQFALMGDSAGGNLAMSTALNLKKLQLPSPLYQVLISPWLNLRTEYASYAENETNDPIITKEFVTYAAANYTAPENFSDPLVSPVLGSFTGLGPTLTLVGTKEILRDDSVHLHRALEKAGCISKLKTFDQVTHVWTLTDIESAESKETLQLIREFMASVSTIVPRHP
ncbi:alpha/beta hydrolase [Fulvivirgaceae bacterium PWU4]|uniref:Alpha/beta hydrolase n=1 Tax=Chryseosolibacter histidini TaxID=2782349 RepID=A0AAP2DKM1_9BACT|nr:alpha/beta hydrolase [Chryseosolibacter histidini]MBT1697063.1 alpha/beta hydrolase [Chryseosolibacter histidini]